MQHDTHTRNKRDLHWGDWFKEEFVENGIGGGLYRLKEEKQDLSSGPPQNRQTQGIEGRSFTWDTKMSDPKRQKGAGDREIWGDRKHTQRFSDGIMQS